MFEKSIDFLLENACVSIKYLVHRDMLKTPIDDPTMQVMQTEVLKQPIVQKILAKQHPDGWIGYELHGNDSIETIMRLVELGVEPDNEHIEKAINALLTPEIAGQHKNHFAAGYALDADGRGGNKAITAGILAAARVSEDTQPLADEIELSFKHLSGALAHNSIDDFTIQGSKFRYYKLSVKFPGANHIGVLANTVGWRTDENLQTAKAAMTHCYSLMKDFEGYIMFRKPKEYGGNFMGPFNFGWQFLNPVDMAGLQWMIDNPNRYTFGFWLRSITGHPDWAIQTTQSYELLAELLESDTLMNIMNDKTLQGFRRISGRESNWQNKTAVKCDVVFAVLKACWLVLAKKISD
mgnify:FL=1